jgi:hypothetical protein
MRSENRILKCSYNFIWFTSFCNGLDARIHHAKAFRYPVAKHNIHHVTVQTYRIQNIPVSMKSIVFWDVTPYNLVSVHRFTRHYIPEVLFIITTTNPTNLWQHCIATPWGACQLHIKLFHCCPYGWNTDFGLEVPDFERKLVNCYRQNSKYMKSGSSDIRVRHNS